MPVYIMREGTSNMFKIGLTRSGDIEPRRRQLNSGNSQGLFLFEVVETDDVRACEALFHCMLAPQRVSRGGGTEFFEMDSEDHMSETISQVRQMDEKRGTAKCAITEFEKMKCSQILIEPIANDTELLAELREIEIRELEIKAETASLKCKREVIEGQLKLRIGGSLGIRGIATWEATVRRNFSEELFRERDPQQYEDIFERFHCLDKKAWKTQEPARYKQIQTTHFNPSVTRKLKIICHRDRYSTI